MSAIAGNRRAPLKAEPLLGEEWRFAPGFEPYEVSSLGRVKRGDRLLRAILDHGYFYIDTSINSRRRRAAVHTLVALAFIGRAPSEDHEIAHFDGDGLNNQIPNLRWATPLENAGDRSRHGRTAGGASHGCAFLTAAQVAAIREEYRWKSQTHGTVALGRKYGVSAGQIHKIITGEAWKDERAHRPSEAA